MTQAERIIAKFGTQLALANAIGCNQSVVAGWKLRGWIPAPQQSRVLEAAQRAGIALSPADFFDPPANSSESAGAVA